MLFGSDVSINLLNQFWRQPVTIETSPKSAPMALESGQTTENDVLLNFGHDFTSRSNELLWEACPLFQTKTIIFAKW